MKARVESQKILEALRSVRDHERGDNIVTLGMVSGVHVGDAGDVIVPIEVAVSKGAQMEPLRLEVERVVGAMCGVSSVKAILTAQSEASDAPDASVPSKRKAPQQIPGLLPQVKKLIAVASGKGGVGKSTVTSNLAIALAREGLTVGLLDADIYGPSQPRMMGLEGRKPGGTEGKIDPLEAHGVKVMSIGFMVDANAPLIWRGPMVQSALVQLMRDVSWGALDVLLIDMPPGTGDAQLTMAQKVPLSGAIIVSTPQDIALLDARKGVEMFRKVTVPIVGMIENMSTHVCSNCGHEDHIFGHDGARLEAEAMGVDFLGAIPLLRDIRLASDAGEPFAGSDSDAKNTPYAQLAKKLIHSNFSGL